MAQIRRNWLFISVDNSISVPWDVVRGRERSKPENNINLHEY